MRKTLIEKEVVLIVYVVKLILPQLKNDSVMATEFVLIPKHKYEQLEKDAAPKDGSESTPPSPHTTDNNDNHPDLSHEGLDDSNTDDDNDDYDASDVLESFDSTKLKYV